MTLREAMRAAIEAARAGNVADLRRMVDRLRFRPPAPCAPFDYEDLLAFAERAMPGLSRPEWDALLAEIDDSESE